MMRCRDRIRPSRFGVTCFDRPSRECVKCVRAAPSTRTDAQPASSRSNDRERRERRREIKSLHNPIPEDSREKCFSLGVHTQQSAIMDNVTPLAVTVILVFCHQNPLVSSGSTGLYSPSTSERRMAKSLWPSSESHWADVPSDLGRTDVWANWGSKSPTVQAVKGKVNVDFPGGSSHGIGSQREIHPPSFLRGHSLSFRPSDSASYDDSTFEIGEDDLDGESHEANFERTGGGSGFVPPNFADFKQSVQVEHTFGDSGEDEASDEAYRPNSFTRYQQNFQSRNPSSVGGLRPFIVYEPSSEGVRVTQEFNSQHSFDSPPSPPVYRPQRETVKYGTTINHVPNGQSYSTFTNLPSSTTSNRHRPPLSSSPPVPSFNINPNTAGYIHNSGINDGVDYDDGSSEESFSGPGGYGSPHHHNQHHHQSRYEELGEPAHSGPSGSGVGSSSFENVRGFGDDILDSHFNQFQSDFESSHNRDGGVDVQENFGHRDRGESGYQYRKVNYREPIQRLYNKEDPDEESREYGSSYGTVEAYKGEYDSDKVSEE